MVWRDLDHPPEFPDCPLELEALSLLEGFSREAGLLSAAEMYKGRRRHRSVLWQFGNFMLILRKRIDRLRSVLRERKDEQEGMK